MITSIGKYSVSHGMMDMKGDKKWQNQRVTVVAVRVATKAAVKAEAVEGVAYPARPETLLVEVEIMPLQKAKVNN